MLNAGIVSASSIGTRASFDPWEGVRLGSQMDIAAHLKRCRDDLLVRRKIAKNTSHGFFGQESVAASVVGEPSGKSGVRFSNIAEVADVQFTSD